MLRVFNWMTSGLLLTGIVAYAIAHTGLSELFYTMATTPEGRVVPHPTGLGLISIFAPLAFVMVLSLGVNRLSRSTAQLLYWLFAAAMGASLTNIFFIYTESSIGRVFFITAATFAAMSIYGYTTRRDLSRMGSFLMMGLIGIIIASVVNIFVHSTMIAFVVSVIGVLVFAGLTAFDTQNLKRSYYAVGGSSIEEHSAIMGAMQLYLDFVNLFLLLLRFVGDRR